MVALTLFALIAFSIALILDLDRPATGTIIIPITPFNRSGKHKGHGDR
jgi:hypothetical protein